MNAAADTHLLLPRIRSALFEIAAREPQHAPRWVLWVVCTLVIVLLAWAIFAHLDIVAVAQGRLVPQTYVKIVQPAEAGIVREILVDEGDRVKEGQVLVRLDATENTADSTAAERELAIQRLQVRRIDAELQGRPMSRQPQDDAALFSQAQAQARAHRQQFLDSIAQENASRERAVKELAASVEILRKLEKTLPSYQRSADSYEKLAAEKLVGTLQAEEKRRDATEKAQDLESQRATVDSLQAAVSQSDRRIVQLKSTYDSELRTARMDALQRATQLEQDGVKLKYRQGHLELRAPQAGTVKELATTTIGAVVQPGTVLLSLVPVHEPLLAEVAVENQDIGFVRPGHHVRLKVATYPFQKYGMLEGVVKTVIADASAQKTDSPRGVGQGGGDAPPQTQSFKAMIELREQAIGLEGAIFPLAAGMQLTAEIVEGKRSVLEYLLSPVRRVTSEAGMER